MFSCTLLSAVSGTPLLESQAAHEPAPVDHAVPIGLPARRWGVGLGNGYVYHGIRLNIRESHVALMNGINLSLGPPGKNPLARYRGLSVGVIGTSAHRIDGASVNLLGVGADRGNGVIGSFGLTTGAELRGVGFGTLACAFLDTRGVAVAGLNVAGSRLCGLLVAGVGIVGEDLHGIMLSGVGLIGRETRGLGISSAITSRSAHGVHVGLIMTKTGACSGISAGLVNICTGRMAGLSIGLINHAQSLRGVQIGLLNHVAQGKREFRWLPLINARF